MIQTPDTNTHPFKAIAIIVAGGSGTRMQLAMPKQFLLLNGRPVILHTIDAFLKSSYQPSLILVLPEPYHSYWNELCQTYAFHHPHTLIGGGNTRFQSVKNALDSVTETDALVAVHDAVRPLITPETINASYQLASQYGNAVTAIKSRDSVRRVQHNISESIPREEIYLIQTPQTFELQQLRNAYNIPYVETFTDDASVVEQAGYKIHLAEGSHRNLKITFAEDLAIAEFLLQKKELS